MPAYDFKCEVCSDMIRKFMSVKDYVDYSKDTLSCEKCENGVMVRVINRVTSEVEKTREQILEEARDYAIKTNEKIMKKDEKTIRDIYGSEPNPHKQH